MNDSRTVSSRTLAPDLVLSANIRTDSQRILVASLRSRFCCTSEPQISIPRVLIFRQPHTSSRLSIVRIIVATLLNPRI